MSERVLLKIEEYLQLHTQSTKIQLDEKSKRVIELRFWIKCREGPNAQAHVCLIFDRKQCISVGINSNRQHAEVEALKKWLRLPLSSKERKRGTWRMMVVRFSKTGIFNNSRPCFHCSQFLKKHTRHFHSISYSDLSENLCILSKEQFHTTCFHHISRGNCMKLERSTLPLL